ncbi:hypothetical protein FRUB_04429 [Fimbriiglobus ruber]|uniref:Uncharacterized protein n=2 Tax=Fimbriiglobus ruber TaxID=1908690 RepID=A0A225DLQ8_9BACT|nr:hypothetical protein FRUB_04429 [Fimbriiglobus ruber]
MRGRRLWVGLFIGTVLVGGFAPRGTACPFCSSQGQTLTGEVNQADFIVLGTLKNPKRDPNDILQGTTDLAIETVVKPNDFLKGKTTIRIPRFVGVEAKFLIFCSFYTRPIDHAASALIGPIPLANTETQMLDAYRAEPIRPDSKIAEYLRDAIEVRKKDSITQLTFFFNHLDSPDVTVSSDALNEFGRADYKEVRAVAEKLTPEKLVRWLNDPNTHAGRFGLYGLMLGHCGKKSDVKTIRTLLEGPKDRIYSSGLEGLMAAYILLDKQPGWDYLMGILKDANQEFAVRYAGLKVLQFFWLYRSDVVAHDDVLEGMKLLVARPDMADLPIEDLRKWGAWGLTDYVLKFADVESHKSVPIIRRSMLRFALSAPAMYPNAAAYVAKIRKEDPERVQFVEQTLKDEQPKPAEGAAGAGK